MDIALSSFPLIISALPNPFTSHHYGQLCGNRDIDIESFNAKESNCIICSIWIKWLGPYSIRKFRPKNVFGKICTTVGLGLKFRIHNLGLLIEFGLWSVTVSDLTDLVNYWLEHRL